MNSSFLHGKFLLRNFLSCIVSLKKIISHALELKWIDGSDSQNTTTLIPSSNRVWFSQNKFGLTFFYENEKAFLRIFFLYWFIFGLSLLFDFFPLNV